jgi:protein subunit release factor A
MTEQTIADKLQDVQEHYHALSLRLADPEVFGNSDLLSRYAREQAEIEPLASLAHNLQQIDDDIALYSAMTEPSASKNSLPSLTIGTLAHAKKPAETLRSLEQGPSQH